MNFFYGINNNIFKTQLQIPIFKNREFKKSDLDLFKIYPKNNKWVLEKILNKKINDYFYVLKNDDISNNEIFFLSDHTIFEKFDQNKIIKYNNFTDTNPAYRANFEIYLNEGGFSSYQSEYPLSMIAKKGTILSSISSLSNPDADKNYVLIKNIFENPVEENFKIFFVNYKTRSIEEQFQIKTNYTNCIEINNRLIKPEIFLVTDKYLGVPMYISVKNNFLSFEHTHPPHEYILSENKFVKVSNLKKDINEIIN
ncbi:MAG: hypothetical protein CMI99_03700 [Pelagibacteraceae bacterium]|nr:hypothetical protein [Pelagibacteraceae bacterium]|tara:strand:+ start:341 stop:1102 length:762 start_codon:yes stop_codon:yes gene_type:complete